MRPGRQEVRSEISVDPFIDQRLVPHRPGGLQGCKNQQQQQQRSISRETNTWRSVNPSTLFKSGFVLQAVYALIEDSALGFVQKCVVVLETWKRSQWTT
jgi:hypothetical protein